MERAIDCWVNVRMGGARASWQERVALEYFKRSAGDVFRDVPLDELVAVMDRLSVERAILPVRADYPNREILEFAERRPDRFALAATVDPRGGYRVLRDLERLVKTQPVVVAQVIPCLLDLPPSDRAYYPLYTRCVDLGLPISINTGIPGPPLPSECQDPMHLDPVCRFFPELTVVMANGADPWWGVAIRLMLKYPRLHLMTSAYSPKYLPVELLHYMNTRGTDRVIFATDSPFLSMERGLEEARALELRPQAAEAYLHGNARRVFFSRAGEAAPSS